MSKYSQEAAALWNEYADEFQRRWGIDREVAAIVGARAKKVFAAEYAENGDEAYARSVLLPIRNAMYSASVIDERWEVLQDMDLKEPILDYGCGVGFQLLWLKRHGFTNLYGYEIPGVQQKVMARMLESHGIGVWTGEQVATVLCINVLEHMTDPLAFLARLSAIGKRVIANIDTSDDESHIASHADLDKCRIILEEHGTLYEAA